MTLQHSKRPMEYCMLQVPITPTQAYGKIILSLDQALVSRWVLRETYWSPMSCNFFFYFNFCTTILSHIVTINTLLIITIINEIINNSSNNKKIINNNNNKIKIKIINN